MYLSILAVGYLTDIRKFRERTGDQIQLLLDFVRSICLLSEVSHLSKNFVFQLFGSHCKPRLGEKLIDA